MTNRLSLVTYRASEPFEALLDVMNITCEFKTHIERNSSNFGLNILGTSIFRKITFGVTSKGNSHSVLFF